MIDDSLHAEVPHEEVRMLRDSARALFADHVNPGLLSRSEEGEFATLLWEQISGLGFLDSAVAESRGGAGLPLSAALSTCFEAGEYALPLPLGETIVARWLLDQAGVQAPEGFTALAFDASPQSGMARHVPWARHAGHVVVCDAIDTGIDVVSLRLIPTSACAIARYENIAGEPRDHVRWDAADPQAQDVAISPRVALSARLAMTTVRSLQLAGAMAHVLEMTVRYAGERVQFGKPLGKLQAIQQYLAMMAGQAASARVAAEFALERLAGRNEALASATAKVRCGQAAGIVARHAHQIHGAMGFTHEHPLHWTTRRMWAWRDEYGSEAIWADRVAQLIIDSPDDLWSMVTECGTVEAPACN